MHTYATWPEHIKQSKYSISQFILIYYVTFSGKSNKWYSDVHHIQLQSWFLLSYSRFLSRNPFYQDENICISEKISQIEKEI